jgi:hypothetical protein
MFFLNKVRQRIFIRGTEDFKGAFDPHSSSKVVILKLGRNLSCQGVQVRRSVS